MANISLTLYTNGFIGSVLMSPIQMGSLRVNNSVTNISRLGTFKDSGSTSGSGSVITQLKYIRIGNISESAYKQNEQNLQVNNFVFYAVLILNYL